MTLTFPTLCAPLGDIASLDSAWVVCCFDALADDSDAALNNQTFKSRGQIYKVLLNNANFFKENVQFFYVWAHKLPISFFLKIVLQSRCVRLLSFISINLFRNLCFGYLMHFNAEID